MLHEESIANGANGANGANRSDEARRTTCPVCHAAPLHLTGTFCPEARLCPSCGHLFTAVLPTASELEVVYATYGYDNVDANPLPSFLDGLLLEIIDRFEPFRKTGRLLDVGFGAGGLLRVAKTRGWTTLGVEKSAAAVELGTRHAIGQLFHADFLDLPLEPGSLDVIVMQELIEHLPDPMPFLRQAARLLRSGGLLYMTTPHGRGVSGRILGPSWSVMRPPEHLQLFSVRSMRRCLEEAGFASSRLYTQGILPHELLAAARRRLAKVRSRSATAKATVAGVGGQRVEKGYRLNAALSGSASGRAAKKLANLALGATSLGDSLRVEAVR